MIAGIGREEHRDLGRWVSKAVCLWFSLSQWQRALLSLGRSELMNFLHVLAGMLPILGLRTASDTSLTLESIIFVSSNFM